ncbi:MAG: hypothetical protein AB7O52_11825 [Planctomycetota bacterium]
MKPKRFDRSVAGLVLAAVLHLGTSLADGQCYLPAPVPLDLAPGLGFGRAVALAGGRCVVGAPLRDGGPGCFLSGGAYVFELVSGTWIQQDLMPAPTPPCLAYLGESVAIEGSVVVIGSPGWPASATSSGAVLVYELVSGQWSLTAQLTPSDAPPFSCFGNRVKLSQGRLIVASVHDGGLQSSGALYVFEKVGAVWTEQQKLVASQRAAFDFFAADVAIDGSVMVIGARGVEPAGAPASCDSGAAYVFEYLGGSWVEVQMLVASDANCTHEGSEFGTSVAISGTVIAVGAPRADFGCPPGPNGSDCNRGVVYVFRRSSVWQEEAMLVRTPSSLEMGYRVAFDGPNRLVAEGRRDLINFSYSTTEGWSQESILVPPGTQVGGGLGFDLAVSDGYVLVGEPFTNGNNQGQVHYYANTPPGVGCESPFIRGDCNTDGTKNIADAVFGLTFLFPIGTITTLSCEDACDANDDGAINIADPVALLAELFGGPSIPLPPPTVCDADPTLDSTFCASNAACP